MFEKIAGSVSNLVKQDGEKVGQYVMRKIETDFVRSPKADSFVYNPIKKNYGQKLAELEERLSSFVGKEEILKHTNESNVDAVLKLSQIKNNDGKFAYDYNLKSIAPKITPKNKDVVVAIAKIKDSGGAILHRCELMDLMNMMTDKNKDLILQMATAKSPKGEYVHRFFELVDAVKFKDEISHKKDNVLDFKIFEYIKQKNTPHADVKTLKELDTVIDVHNAFNKKYSHIRTSQRSLDTDTPCNQEYYQYRKGNHRSPRFTPFETEDCINEARIEREKLFCKYNPDHELSNHFYNKYYLKSDMVPKEMRATCEEINEKFGTKVFLSSEYSEGSLNYIKRELSEWKNASNGEAKMPRVLDFSKTKVNYINEEAAYGQGCSAGFAEAFNDSISLNGLRIWQVKPVLRHELTHINDLKKGCNIPHEYNLDEIMPMKENEEGKMVIDFDNCKHKEEFYNAGIPRGHVPYAYNNTKEFIAVAAEGDMSKYSSGFKQVLTDFGMPEWMFKMSNSDKIERDAIIDTAVERKFNRLDFLL